MWIVASIAAPVIGILVVIIWSMTQEPEKRTTVIDPNKDLAVLERQIPELKQDASAVWTLWLDEAPSVRSRIESLKRRCDRWMEQFDAIVKENDMVDENGRLKSGFEEWGQARSKVSGLRGDLIKNFP